MIQGPVITPQERELIETLIADGFTTTEIGAFTGRSPSTIRNEIQRNGGMKNYRADKAQKRYFEMKGKQQKPFSRFKDIEDRLDIIEKYIREKL